jgi:DnaJ-class molecular chaperone
MIRCPRCEGYGYVFGRGRNTHPCPECDSLGYVASTPEELQEANDQ